MVVGMVTLEAQRVTLDENNNRVRLQGLTDDQKQWTITVATNLTNTQSLADKIAAGETTVGCIGDLSLRDKLVDSSKDRFFLLQVDKTSLGSASGGQKGHRFSLHWHTPPHREIDLSIDTPTVTLVSLPDVEPRVFKFSEGTVKVRDRSGGGRVKDSTSLSCDNKDDIFVTLTILP